MREIGEAKIQRCLGNATDSSAFEGLPARSQPLLPNYGHRRFFVTGESPRDGANGNVVRLRQALNVQIWLQRDINVDGGFKEDLHTTLRVMKLF